MRIQQRTFSESFGRFIQAKRAAAGETQVRYSARLGISSSYLSQMEQGVVPLRTTLQAMVDRLGEDAEQWLKAAGYDDQQGVILREPALGQTTEIDRDIPRLGAIGTHGLIELYRKEEQQGDEMRYALVVKSGSPGVAFQDGDILLFESADSAHRNARVIIEESDGARRLVRYMRTVPGDEGKLSVSLLDAPGLPKPVKVQARIVAKFIGMLTPDY